MRRFEETAPVYCKSIVKTRNRHPELFASTAEFMLDWAEQSIGPDYFDTLIKGYVVFVNDVNRSQAEYERAGHYKHSTSQEIANRTYHSREFMETYHWGVFTSQFVWEHHLQIIDFFNRQFLPLVSKPRGRLLDLGCGSGIWTLLALHSLADWHATLIDISSSSLEKTATAIRRMAPGRCDATCTDAVAYRSDASHDAVISCFLLEHVDHPAGLLRAVAAGLKVREYAFVTAALTAAETDHIKEFRRESEVFKLAEEAGLRIVAALSASPQATPPTSRFLPRSTAMILQKRLTDIW